MAPPPSFGQNLIRLRERAGFKTAKALADKLGIAASGVSRWENDVTGLPETSTVFRLASILECKVEELLAGVDDAYEEMLRRAAQKIAESPSWPDGDVEVERIDVSGHTRDDIPVIAEGDASPQPDLFWDNAGSLYSEVEDRITRPYDVKDPRAYGLRVRGDSMVPIYRPGQLLVVSPNTTATDGDEVYVQLLSGERLIKIAYRQTNGWVLESANPAYAPRFVMHEQVGAIHPILWSRRKARGTRNVRVPDGSKTTSTNPSRRVRERHEAPNELPAAAREHNDDDSGDER